MKQRAFTLAQDAVDPARVPARKLSNGQSMPCIGLGTFGNDFYTDDQIADAVLDAIALGYRHIDCARVYGNEKAIGEALKAVIDSGLVKREELFITSKLWNDMHHDGDVLVSLAHSLRDLQLDYLDMYLVHWPFPNYHAPGCDGDSRNPESRPFFVEEFMDVWRQMERLVDLGLVRGIGTSNVTKPKLEAIWAQARVKPAVNEMELHPHFQQQELFDYVRSLGIAPVGFSPIGSPVRPERDRTPTDTVDIEDPVIVSIAERHGVHPAVVCLKWAVQRGQTPIPLSVKRANIRMNLLLTTEDPLSDDEMNAIAGIDKNCRLVKGQVFLWPGASGWENLWDLDGEIDRCGWQG